MVDEDHLTIEDTVVETPPGPPGYSALLLKLRPDGKKVWVRSVEGDVLLRGVATNDAGEIWLAGAFAQQISISSTDVVSDAARQGLLLKLTP